MMHLGNMAGWGMGFWWIGGLILLGFFVWLIVTALGRSANHPYHSESPIDILKKRYARGELSKEEFDRISSDLRSYK